MTAQDQIKVLNAGFMILRRDYFRLKIKCKTKDFTEWRTLEKDFASKAEIDRRMNDLLKRKKVIED